MADQIQAIKPIEVKPIKAFELPEIKPIGTDSAPKRQSLQEWHAAGGGVPMSHKDRPDVWRSKVQRLAGGGGVYNTEPDMSDGGQLIDGPAFAAGGGVHMGKGGKMGVGLKIADAVADASRQAEAMIEAKRAGKLEEALAAKTAPMTTPQGTGLPLMPRSQGMYTPGVKQEDLPRMPNVDKARAAGKSPKYTERMQDLLDSPTARKKVDTLIRKGEELGMREWYGTEPLRQVAMDAGLSPDEFRMFMAQMASASQRNPVDQQNKMGSYLWHLSRTGQLPEDAFLLTNKIKKNPSLAPEGTPIELPPSYGSLAQGDIFSRGKQIASGDIEGALPPEKKLGTFYRNYLGNLRPVTVDVNAVRGPIIERGDPRWLASKLVEKDEEGRVIAEHFPRRDVAEGRMSLKEARDRPGFWEAAPSGSEYAGFEDLWQRGAKRHGLSPAEAQALGWYGSADVTALKTKPELYIDNLERMIRRTAEETGQNPIRVMEDVLRGKEYLRKEGGAVEKHFDGGGLAAADFAGPSDDDDFLKARLTAKILAGMARDQAAEEGRSMSKPRAVTDVLNRGVVAPLIGTAADIGNLALEGVDYLRGKASGKPVEKRLASDRPFMGTDHIRDLMREYGMTTDAERPMMETGLSIISPGGALKGAVKGAEALPKAGRAVEGGLNAATAAMRRPFTPATVTMEAVAPDLAKYKPRDWQETATRRLTGEGAPVSMDVMGGRKTTKRPGQGVYENFEGQLETNPLVAVDVPFAGSLSGNKALRADITTAGQELAQESVAAHRFVPMATNQIKDASAMLIGTKNGKLSNKEIIELGERLPGMIVAHNPRLGGIVVMPYDYTKGKVPAEFSTAQDVAKSVLGKRADFTYGKADPMKDRLYIERSDYVKEGARPPSAESKAMRERLQRAEERLFRAPAQSARGPRQGRAAPATTAD